MKRDPDEFVTDPPGLSDPSIPRSRVGRRKFRTLEYPRPDAEECLLHVVETIRALDNARAVAPNNESGARDRLKGVDSELWNIVEALQDELYDDPDDDDGARTDGGRDRDPRGSERERQLLEDLRPSQREAEAVIQQQRQATALQDIAAELKRTNATLAETIRTLDEVAAAADEHDAQPRDEQRRSLRSVEGAIRDNAFTRDEADEDAGYHDALTDGGIPVVDDPGDRERDWLCAECGCHYHGRPEHILERDDRGHDIYCSDECLAAGRGGDATDV